MKLYPTRTAFHLALAGGAVVAFGLVSMQPSLVGWGAALIAGLAVARGATLVSVARIRAAGFEMLWSSSQRTIQVSRGGEVTIEAEVRNRDTLAAKYVGLRAIASSQLVVTIDPPEGEVPASGKLRVAVKVRAPRVGRHGIFGLALEVRGAPGLFEVPLTFANPFGVEVRPASFAAHVRSALGGRTRLSAEGGAAGRSSGEGLDLREVREYRPGDPFRRIAWRASARKGKLIVREMEHEERELIWVVLDASVELWAGAPGSAPLDGLIDDCAVILDRHLRHGDMVGLAVAASRVLRLVPPGKGAAHAAKLHQALSEATGVYDRDRSDLDEHEVASRVLEHLRPLDAGAPAELSRRDLDKLVQRASAMMARAPFQAEAPEAPTVQERRLRQYLSAFGVEVPARGDAEHARTIEVIAALFDRWHREKPRPSAVYVVGPAPEISDAAFGLAVSKLRRGGVQIRWILPSFEASLSSAALDDGRPETGVLLRAMQTRARLGHDRALRALRRTGVQVERLRRPRPRLAVPEEP
jgi:uncharacterized protein (DUF58 family)